MKTKSELLAEAHRLEQRVHESTVLSRASVGARGIVSSGAIPVLIFPDTSVRLSDPSDSGLSFTHILVRYILARQDRTNLEYKLMEEESVADSEDRVVRRYDPVELATSERAVDVLSAGFRRIDEDRLLERLEPITAEFARNGFTHREWEDALSTVQEVTSDLALCAASQMRVKSDAIDLLEGRLELGDFIARTVARQDCFDFEQRIELTNEFTESIVV